jgi:DNA polymerase-4
VIPGVGPVTQERLHRIGIRTVADLQAVGVDEIVRLIGQAHGQALIELAFARDDRSVEPERESKSISVEDTFETDVVDAAALRRILARDAGQVAARLRAARLFARTVTIKIRRHDFTTHTRSRTLLGATDRVQVISDVAQSLLSGVDTAGGIRLLGLGVAGLTDVLQEDLFGSEGTDADQSVDNADVEDLQITDRLAPRWIAGADIQHDDHGRGWVWGSGAGRVTVRFESRDTPPGPIHTFPMADPKLHLV